MAGNEAQASLTVADLRRELLLAERTALPIDAEAERFVVSNLLERAVTHDELAPLESKHFGIPFFGDIFDATREAVGLGPIAESLSSAGYGPSAIRDFYTLTDDSPFLPAISVKRYAKRIVETWQRRKLAAVCRQVAEGLCTETIDFSGGVDQLRAVILDTK